MAKFTSEILIIFANCLSGVETGGQVYGNGDWNDITLQYTNSDIEHAITIGAFARLGVEAKEMLVRIRKKYPDVFSKYDTAGISADLDTSDWSRYQLPTKTCAKAKAIAAIISTPEGILVQKEMVGEDVQKKADIFEERYGVHRIDALLHLVNIAHLGGGSADGPLKRIVGRISGEITLEKIRDSLLKDTVRNQVGAEPYKKRQALMYQWIHEKVSPLLDSDGLVKENSEMKGDNQMSYDISKVISVARGEKGYLEKASNSNLDSKTANAGSNNFTKYWRDMANLGLGNYQGQYWCACFIAWCFYVAYGLKAMQQLLLHSFFINCATMANLASRAGRLSSIPQVGAVALFKSSSKGYYHTELVVGVTGSQFTTVGGNTSGGSSVIANGGGVAEKVYNRNSINAMFFMPDYGTGSSSVVTSKGYLAKGDTGSEVTVMQTKLIACGFSCGNAGADGDFGSGTYGAVVAFQKYAFPNNSSEWDGQYGPKTKAKLEALYTSKTNSMKKSVDEIAREVIAGKWSSGDERKEKLKSAGYDYQTVQNKVNELLGGSAKKSVTEIAKEVIAGWWGNGTERRAKIEKAGYSYSEVQKTVNALLN